MLDDSNKVSHQIGNRYQLVTLQSVTILVTLQSVTIRSGSFEKLASWLQQLKTLPLMKYLANQNRYQLVTLQ